MSEKTDALQKQLETVFGHSSFRPFQEEIVRAVLSSRDVLAVLPTGHGKSICYQLPATMREGLTLVITPLVSLMKDQVDALQARGLPSMWINSTLTPKGLREAQEELAKGETKLLYIAPERLKNDDFIFILHHLPIALIAVDEAHCISSWGHDFRPSYRKIGRLLRALPSRPALLALTATATADVEEDIVQGLEMNHVLRFRDSFDRANLSFSVEMPENRLDWLLEHLHECQPSSIVYCLTRNDVERTAKRLMASQQTRTVYRYHAGMKQGMRAAAQEAFLQDDRAIMVATNAFGMGIDKADIHSIIHLGMPKDMESYYQEAGRGGRDQKACRCILLFGPKDLHLHRQMIFSRPFYLRKSIPHRLEKLASMLSYVFGDLCLRKILLQYFQEAYPGTCQNCSVCQQEKPWQDLTKESQILLSTMHYMQEKMSVSLLVQTVRKSRAKPVLAQGMDGLSTYGLLQDWTDHQIRMLLFYLEAHHYILREPGKYGRLFITKKGAQLLRGQRRILIAQNIGPPSDEKTTNKPTNT